MTIREVCAKYRISQDTLRYYERMGAIPAVHRSKNGIRDYTEQDPGWVENALCRLVHSGLPDVHSGGLGIVLLYFNGI